MSKISRKAISIFTYVLLVLTTLAVPALAAPSDFTITASADKDSAKPGDVVTVNVTVTGAQFCAVDVELSFDTERFEYISSMPGWSDGGDGRLEFYNANASGGYWEDGKVLGTFKFMVKDNAPAGEAAFCVGKDSSVFIVGDWAEGASSEPAKPLEAHQLINTAVTVTGGQSENAPLPDYGAISDDGSTLNMEAGHHVYSIPDTESGQVVWQSSDESVMTVDEDGLVTAVSDGSAVLTAKDKDGNELEQRTVIVGAVQEAPEETAPETSEEAVQPEPEETQAQPEEKQPQPEQTAPSVSDEETSKGHLWIAIAALAAVAVCVAVIVVKKKRKEQ